MKLVKSILKLFIYPFIFVVGLISFLFTGKTFNQAYLSFRYLFTLTNGKSNDIISSFISRKVQRYTRIHSQGVLGDLSDDSLQKIVKEIKVNGFYVFDDYLPNNILNELVHFASVTPVSYLEFNKNTLPIP